jgi:hypothetical protein
LRVLELQRREGVKKLSVIGWRLWWEDGGTLPPPARGLLEDMASSWDEQRRMLSELMARDEQVDAEARGQMEDLYVTQETGVWPGRSASHVATPGVKGSQVSSA